MTSILGTVLEMLARPGWASGTELVPLYERAFVRALLTDTRPAVAFGRGRAALWTVLKSFAVEQGSDVIVPAYTCETVPMAVKFAGAKCIYVDSEPGGYNPLLRDVARSVTARTRALICQHTYGIVPQVRDWIRLAAEKQSVLVEDRCQVIQNDRADDGGGAMSDAAYFSMHFSKPFSTTQGGMAVFREGEVASRARRLREGFPLDHERRRARSLALQTLLYVLSARPSTRAFLGSLYRWAQRAGLIRGTIARDEYSAVMPGNYLTRATNLQAVLGITQLDHWNDNRRHRERLTEFYLERLETLGVNTGMLRAGRHRPALLMVPVLVENKAEVLKQAMRRGIPVGTWFDRLPAHIQPRSAPLYDYTPGQCPRSEYLIPREIHLLTAPWVSLRQAERAVRFLERHARWADPLHQPEPVTSDHFAPTR